MSVGIEKVRIRVFSRFMGIKKEAITKILSLVLVFMTVGWEPCLYAGGCGTSCREGTDSGWYLLHPDSVDCGHDCRAKCPQCCCHRPCSKPAVAISSTSREVTPDWIRLSSNRILCSVALTSKIPSAKNLLSFPLMLPNLTRGTPFPELSSLLI